MIITNNQDLLRVKCEPVNSDEILDLVKQLELELDNSARLGKLGIGLAAPQIGISKHIAIVRFDKYNINLVNCKIINQYDLMSFKDEGCLSFPGELLDTKRYNEIVIDNNGEKMIAEGMLAVVIQHELDHLNQVLFMDRAEAVKNKSKLRPNDLCNCGKLDINTGRPKKYKKCCGA